MPIDNFSANMKREGRCSKNPSLGVQADGRGLACGDTDREDNRRDSPEFLELLPDSGDVLNNAFIQPDIMQSLCQPLTLSKTGSQGECSVVMLHLATNFGNCYRPGGNAGSGLGARETWPALASSNSTLLFCSVVPAATSN